MAILSILAAGVVSEQCASLHACFVVVVVFTKC